MLKRKRRAVRALRKPGAGGKKQRLVRGKRKLRGGKALVGRLKKRPTDPQKATYDQGFNQGYNQGFDEGFSKAFEEGYQQAYMQG
jgi:flagellar biosynthesis/type III secretory pathway protein FliH